MERSLAIVRPWLAGARLGDVLDVGCGTAALLPRLAAWDARPARYAGVDASPEMLHVARARCAAAAFPAALAAGDAEQLPLRAASFDTVVSASSLHDWTSPAAAFAEVRRVLRPGGRFVLLDWSRDPPVMKLAAAAMRLARVPYERTYARAEVSDLLAAAGFRVVRQARGSAGSFWRLMAFDALLDG